MQTLQSSAICNYMLLVATLLLVKTKYGFRFAQRGLANSNWHILMDHHEVIWVNCLNMQLISKQCIQVIILKIANHSNRYEIQNQEARSVGSQPSLSVLPRKASINENGALIDMLFNKYPQDSSMNVTSFIVTIGIPCAPHLTYFQHVQLCKVEKKTTHNYTVVVLVPPKFNIFRTSQ